MLELICVGLALTLLVLAADVYCYGRGFILYYGDAEAHLNISRSVIDSRTPGYDQLGSVWLPVLHVLCLPFVGSDVLWSSGLAGTIPVSLCFVIAGLFLYSAGKLTYASSLAATVVLACFALNPNLLYLAAIPMTELVFLAGLALLLYAGISFQRDNGQRAFWFGVFSCWWVSLTRYEGWFLIPFAAAWFGFSARRKRLWTSIAFVSFASLAPIYWLAHNWFITGNPFDFFNGPYSPHAIQGNRNYPGYHDWKTAFAYYTEAAKLCAGPCLLIFGAVGLLLSRFRHTLLAVAFLLLPLLFYVWSIHSSSVPVFVPTLWPNSYYNTRYGIVAVVWAAFACGAIVMAVPARWRRFALVLPVLVLSPWLIHPSKDNVICWKESEVNSISRRAWTNSATALVRMEYRSGQGIIASFGDPIGIFCQSKIHLRQVLHVGNGPEWLATTSRPDLVHRELWALAQQGDALSKSLEQRGSPYEIVRSIEVRGAPALLIFKRGHE